MPATSLVGDIGLTSARWQVLGAIAPPPLRCRSRIIARNMGLTRQAVQRLANDLERDGLIRFATNPHHERAKLVMLTEAGSGAFADRHAAAGAVGGAARQGHEIDRPRGCAARRRGHAQAPRSGSGRVTRASSGCLLSMGRSLSGSLALGTRGLLRGCCGLRQRSSSSRPGCSLDNRSLLIEWQHAYPAGAKMQGTLAIVTGLAGIWTAWVSRDWRWLLGAGSDPRQLALHACGALPGQPRADGARARRGQWHQPCA